jgi:hypothetical protein
MALLFANNSSLTNITALPSSVSGGGLNLIKTQTASASSSISFVNGVDGVVLDGTYDEYIFKFINCHPSTSSNLTFQASTDGGSSYGVNITSTFFQAEHNEADTTTGLNYETGKDLAESTNFQRVLSSISANNDDCGSGTLHIFNPSNTTFVKHFIATGSVVATAYENANYVAGYFNTTSALNAFQFKMDDPSANIDDGIIKLYGVS